MPAFLLDPRKRRAKSRRRPGILVSLMSRLPEKAPAWMHGYTRTLDTLLQKIWFALDNSLPAKHGTTHMGGSDSVAGTGIPSPVVAGVEGARGEPREGFAPFAHIHALDLGPIIPDLPDEIPGETNPPFPTLRSQLRWLNAQAAREYAVRPIISNTWS